MKRDVRWDDAERRCAAVGVTCRRTSSSGYPLALARHARTALFYPNTSGWYTRDGEGRYGRRYGGGELDSCLAYLTEITNDPNHRA